MTADVASPVTTRPGLRAWLLPLAIGSAVSLSLGVYGRLHTAAGTAVNVPGFSSPLTLKVWLASLGFTFAVLQLISALVMYGKVPGVRPPSWIGTAHRWSGRIAFLAVVPVAMMCLYALGFESASPRVLIHSVVGCFFFGIFTVKMLVLTRKGMPGWALPLVGGLTFTALTVMWLTSSLWFFTTVGVKF
jgi:Family of unknown function (DUF6529)